MLKYQTTLEIFTRPNGSARVLLFERHGKLHRINSPAEVYETGYMAWWQYDQRHRNHGPAIITETCIYYFWERGAHVEI